MADMSINKVDPQSLHSLNPNPRGSAPSGKGFVDTLKEAFNKVEKAEAEANTSIQDLAVGRRRTLHETMIKVEEAEIAFKMLMAVRGKIMTAYQEVMRMHF